MKTRLIIKSIASVVCKDEKLLYIAIEIATNKSKNIYKWIYVFSIFLRRGVTLAAYVAENIFLFLDESSTLSLFVRRRSNTASFNARGRANREKPLLFFQNKRLTFQAKESIWQARYAIEIRVGRKRVDHSYSENKVSSTLVSLLFSSRPIFGIGIENLNANPCALDKVCVYS